MAISKENYRDFTVEELVQDEFFIESINYPDSQSDTFWKEFLALYPQQQEKVDTAAALIKNLKFRYEKPTVPAKERVWQKVQEVASKSTPVVKMHSRRRWLMAAAAIAGIILLSAGWLFLRQDSKELLVTGNAEIKELILPDRSVVTLNANSSLEYKKDWNSGEPREVWLKGEAFFEVKHLNSDTNRVLPAERFIVHVGTMMVEVLGTSFNVRERKAVTKVVLQSGKVRIDFKENHKESVVMEPGDMVSVNQESKTVVKEKTDAVSQVLWKERKILLNNTTVEELLNTIENVFGYKVEMEGGDILDKQISGTALISMENEETLFKSLEVILNINITKKDNTLFITTK